MCLGVPGQLEEVFEEDGLFKGRVRLSRSVAVEEPTGAEASTAAVWIYGRTLRALRNFTKASRDEEPTWRVPAEDLPSGDEPPWRDEETP